MRKKDPCYAIKNNYSDSGSSFSLVEDHYIHPSRNEEIVIPDFSRRVEWTLQDVWKILNKWPLWTGGA